MSTSTTFTSGKISHDPRPRVFNGSRYEDHASTQDMPLAPRPEFDNDNPILAAFRKGARKNGVMATTALELVNGYQIEFDGASGIVDALDASTAEQSGHARRVLAKLAAL